MDSQRDRVALVLFILGIPLLFLGLIDPLEGGIALLVAASVYWLAFRRLGEPPPRFFWIPFAVTVLIGVLLLISLTIFDPNQPVSGRIPPPIIIGLWIYRLSALITVVSGIAVVLRQMSSRRG